MKWETLHEKLRTVTSKVGKKTIVTVCTVIVLGCMVVLNVILFAGGEEKREGLQPVIDLSADTGNSEIGDNLTATEVNDYFEAMSLNRQQARDEAMEVLLTVTESPTALDEAKQAAFSDMSKLAAEIETESDIEAMILAKGFKQCIAVISNDTCSVIVESEGLKPGEVAQITEIVYEQAGIDPSRLKIVEKNTDTNA